VTFGAGGTCVVCEEKRSTPPRGGESGCRDERVSRGCLPARFVTRGRWSAAVPDAPRRRPQGRRHLRTTAGWSSWSPTVEPLCPNRHLKRWARDGGGPGTTGHRAGTIATRCASCGEDIPFGLKVYPPLLGGCGHRAHSPDAEAGVARRRGARGRPAGGPHGRPPARRRAWARPPPDSLEDMIPVPDGAKRALAFVAPMPTM
jgi:hypothetical protein